MPSYLSYKRTLDESDEDIVYFVEIVPDETGAMDAEQLEFKKLDKDAVIWRTINGNKVPIPKYGSKEDKAKAIKEWFASKNKPLPEKKVKSVAYYGARIEHDRPLLKMSGSGEGANIHGYGQYVGHNESIIRKRYFERFARKINVVTTVPVNMGQLKINEMIANEGLERTKKDYQDALESAKRTLEAGRADVEKSTYFNRETAQKYVERAERRVARLENSLKYIDSVQLSETKQNILLNGNLITKDEEWNVALSMLASGRSVDEERDIYRGLLNQLESVKKYKQDTPAINSIKRKLDFLDKVGDVKNLSYGTPQLTKGYVPARKYFLDEDKRLDEQSNFVKERIVGLITSEVAEDNELSQEDTDLLEDYVKSHLGIADGGKKGRDVEAEVERRKKQTAMSFYGGFPRTAPGVKLSDALDDAYKMMYHGGEKPANGRWFYNGLKDRWYSSKDQRKATNKLKRVGIKGICYNGGIDGECRVLFDPSDFKKISAEKWNYDEE